VRENLTAVVSAVHTLEGALDSLLDEMTAKVQAIGRVCDPNRTIRWMTLRRAREELLISLPHPPPDPATLPASLEELTALAPGPARLTVLHAPLLADDPTIGPGLKALAAAGAQVYPSLRPTPGLAVVDRSSVLLPDPDDPARLVVITMPVLVEPLRQLVLERRNRRPAAAALPPPLVEAAIALIDHDTDRQAAEHLHLGERTLARRIADLYELLGVNTRYQCGIAVSRHLGGDGRPAPPQRRSP